MSRSRRALVVAGAVGGASVLLVAGCTAPGSAPAPAAPSGPGSAGHSSHGGSIAPPSPITEGEGLVTLALARPYQPVAEGNVRDDYRCFLIDPGVAEDRFITGVRFVPGNPEVVHHAIVYRVDASQVAAARTRDAQDDRDGWNCFGGTDLPPAAGDRGLDALASSNWLAAWAPGGTEYRYPSGTGVPLGADEQVVLQVHYNLAAGDGPDSTSVEFRTMPASAGLRPLGIMVLPAPVELPCRPDDRSPLCDRQTAVEDTIARFGGEALRTIWGLQFLCGGDLTDPVAGPTQSCDHRVRADATVFAAAGHMHLLGRSITVDLNPDTPGERRLLDVQNYDFDRQGSKPLPEPVEVKKGDILRVTCTHDTSLRTKLPALQDLEPRYITWGEGTADEMCLGILTLSPRS